MFSSLFKPSPVHAAGLRLLDVVTQCARQPELYAPGRIADTIAGRFEAMALFGGLAVLRLRDSKEAEKVLQAFVDAFFKSLDAGLREAGVGDLTVPKKMKAIAGAVYGRMGAYQAALAEADNASLQAVLARNVFAGEPSAFTADLAAYVRAVWMGLSEAPTDTVETPGAWVRFADWA